MSLYIFETSLVLRWHIQGLLDAYIPVWVPYFSVKINKNDTKNITYLIKYSMQISLHVLQDFAQVQYSKTVYYTPYLRVIQLL